MARREEFNSGRDEHFSETGTPYVPLDYAGQVGHCEMCGNDAPAQPRTDHLKGGEAVQCAPCFQGRRDLAEERRAHAAGDVGKEFRVLRARFREAGVASKLAKSKTKARKQ